MPGPGLKRLLETNQEYGFQREVDQAEVLGDFLSQVWPQNSPKDHENLTHFLSGDNQGTDNIITSGTDDSDLLKKTLNEYLKNTLLIKLDAFEKRILKKKEPENKLEAKDIKKISYHPLNHRFLTEPGIRLGSFLYSCLYKYVDKKRIEIIKKRLISLEHHQEAEEKIVSAIFKWPTESSETWQAKTPEADVPERSKDYKSLFEQFAEDLEALLQLDIKLMSKNRVLLYLERLINLYALLYYLRIICRYTDDKKGQDMDPPLILPLCSNEADDLFKDYSTRCFEVYRQKAVAFWREYLRERIVHNAEELKCINDNAAGILKNFTAYGSQIFGFSQTHDEKVKTPKKTIKKLEEEIKEILDDIKDIEMSNIERFTE
ncbi:MAG: hypothetical protein MUF15_21830, partial [Acidobacteria bacterium]|nr:hypothetical protein [Acidobacteriota bacterium]